jgi:uncharacterized membrane protein
MADKSKGRIEAFSDGVFAIALTLLVLELRPPELSAGADAGRFFAALAGLWPSFLAFVFSFFVVLVMWVNHHELFALARGVDHPCLFANGFLLLLVTFVPFPTAVLARFLGTEAGRAAAAFYCGTFFMTAVAYNLLFFAIAHRRRLVRPDVGDAELAGVRRAYHLGVFVYATSIGLSLWDAAAGLGLCVALWLLWVRLNYQSRRRQGPSPAQEAAEQSPPS